MDEYREYSFFVLVGEVWVISVGCGRDSVVDWY